MVRVLICDDQTVVREGLAAILSTDPEIQVVGLAGDGQEARRLVEETQPDLVLMDLKMPVMNGIQATYHLRRTHPNLPILILTTYADDEWVLDAVHAGAAGYLLKDTRREELIEAIKGTAEGRTYLDPTVAATVLRQAAGGPAPATRQPPSLPDLTGREIEILRLLARGYSNPEIAGRLHLAPGTVRNYVSAILHKLGVSDRTQAAVVAVQLGLLDGAQSPGTGPA